MASETLLARITDYANRSNPYPLYAELREAGPVVRQADGSYLVGTYHEIAALLHDPRMSVDPRSRGEVTHKPPFLRLDDPGTTGCAPSPCGPSARRTAPAGSTPCAARSTGSPRN